jgi:hypothetical protein
MLKPAGLPAQAPTRYPLVVNLKTDWARGLTVPPGRLAAPATLSNGTSLAAMHESGGAQSVDFHLAAQVSAWAYLPARFQITIGCNLLANELWRCNHSCHLLDRLK